MTAPIAARSNRRALIMLGVGLAVLLLFVLVTKVFGGGGGQDLSAPITVPPRAGGPARTTTTTSLPPAESTFEVFSNKNPFVPLAARSTGAGTGSATGGGSAPPPGSGTAVGPGSPTGGTSTGGGTSGGATTGGGQTSGGTVTSTTTPSPGGASQQPRTGQRVALLDVFADGGRLAANVRVNDTVYERLHAGDVFATSFRVVSLDGQCGTFLYGDDRFRLCTGDEVLK